MVVEKQRIHSLPNAIAEESFLSDSAKNAVSFCKMRRNCILQKLLRNLTICIY